MSFPLRGVGIEDVNRGSFALWGLGLDAITTGRKGGGPGRGVIRHRRKPLHAGIREPETAFERAFADAQTKQQEERKANEKIISEQVKTGKLQDVGELGKLSDEDLILIILLMD